MRRLVQHAFAGVGATAFVVVAGVSVLGSPVASTVTLAVPAAVVSVPAPSSSPGAEDIALGADRGVRVDRETREAQRVRITAAAAKAADQRASTLAAEGKALANQQAKIKAAKKKAEAKAKAEAAAAEEARKKAVAARGYEEGVTDPREMARQILENKYGYGANQYSCFNYIIMRESKWSITATNRSSGAYGIPQALPGSKMATIASDWRTNPATQIIWGIEYMKKRYGSPCGAKGFKASHGWY